MHRLRPFLVLALILTGAMPSFAAPTADEIISQARKKIGTEEKLNAVKTLIIEGKQFDAAGKETAYLQLSCKLPWKRKEYSLQQNGTVEFINGTDGIEGYGKIINILDRQGQLRVMSGKDVAAFRALVDSDLRFYATPRGGSVIYEGEKKVQDKECHSLEYIYSGDVHLRRYFDKTTFLLVAQEVIPSKESTGTTLLVTDGEIIASGIRFPKKFLAYEDGKQVGVIEYTTITVNREIPDGDFAFPLP